MQSTCLPEATTHPEPKKIKAYKVKTERKAFQNNCLWLFSLSDIFGRKLSPTDQQVTRGP